MFFETYLEDLNANSYNSELNVQVKSETINGYNIAKFSYRKLKKDLPSDKIFENVPNFFQDLKVLEIIPYFAWIGLTLDIEGKSYKLAIKIKDFNFSDLLQTSVIQYGTLLCEELVVLFYRGQEMYLCPANKKYPMYKKAINLKNLAHKSSANLDSSFEPKENFVCRLKNGLLAIHLGIGKIPSFNFNNLGVINEKEVFMFIKTKKDKINELDQYDFRLNSLSVVHKNPYIEEIGVNKVDFDFEQFKQISWEVKVDKEKDIGLWGKGENLISQELITYIQSLPEDSIENNKTRIVNDSLDLLKNNEGKKLSLLSNERKGIAHIIQMALMLEFKNAEYEYLNSQLKVNKRILEDLLNEIKDSELILMSTYSKDYSFSLAGDIENTNFYNGNGYNGIYSIKDNILKIEKSHSTLTVRGFFNDLLKMKEKGFI